jgi:hypothetical protein
MMTAPAKRRADVTRERLAAMLTENTGRSFLDSGDHYGRHWQRNQGLEFDAQPVSSLQAYVRTDGEGVAQLDLVASLDVYHWLAERLTFNAHRQRCFEKWQARTGNDGQLASMEEYVAQLPDATGIYCDGSPLTVNTYNGEDCLSQTLQYVYWEDSDGAHLLLQIHGGCDVRGGYTDAVWFDVNSELAIFDNARCTLGCPRGCVTWDSDDAGYRFHDSGNRYPEPAIEFRDLEPTTERPEYTPAPDPRQRSLPGVDRLSEFAPSIGLLYVCEETRKAHCPCCGDVLELWG